jgi:hypothetical protein
MNMSTSKRENDMLPPHRPFRDKPVPKIVIKKKTRPTQEGLIAGGAQQGERFDLKPQLVVLSAAVEQASN